MECRARCVEHGASQEVEFLAGPGCRGRQRANLWRAIERVCGSDCAAAESGDFWRGPYFQKSFENCTLAGFSTIIADNREMYANRERFPEADEIFAEEYEELFPRLNVGHNAYIIIVTRGHRDDMRVLRWAVTTEARYIAMIGSKRKVLGVVKELEKENIPRARMERVFAPMGFEIGAITPEEIAVSVVAEMIAVRRRPDSDWPSLSKSIFVEEGRQALAK